MKFSDLIKTIIILSIFFSILYFREEIFLFINKNFLNPCNKSIVYSLGEFDPNFGISEEDFVLAVKRAEDNWESALGKNLFDYGVGGIKVNLIYDYRQEATIEIENIDLIYEEDNSNYNKLEKEYNDNTSLYNLKRSELDQLASTYNQRSLDYKKDVSSWNNSSRNYSQDKYNQLMSEKEFLEGMLVEIRSKQEEINQISNYINYLVEKINEIAIKLNINADKYNNVAESLDFEFEQGSYVSNLRNKEINIYQFKNEDNLVQVLTHELGHSLGLDHSISSDDIMYWLSSGEDQFITSESLDKLKGICYLK